VPWDSDKWVSYSSVRPADDESLGRGGEAGSIKGGVGGEKGRVRKMSREIYMPPVASGRTSSGQRYTLCSTWFYNPFCFFIF